MKQKIKNLNKTYLALSILAVLVLLFYGNTLANGFVLDDRPVIVENQYIQSLEHFPRIVSGCIWESALGGCEGRTLHYRPFHSLSYFVTWQISSSPWFFHFINILYFGAAVFLVFLFTRKITKSQGIAFIAALIFLVHPINSEVANWISAVADLGLVVFVLLSLFWYAKFRETQKKAHLLGTLFFYFMAMLSKEVAVFAVPLLVAAMDFFIYEVKPKAFFQKAHIQKYATFLIPVGVYMAMRQAVLGGFGGLLSNESYLGVFSLAERVGAFFNLFAYGVREILYPYPLSFYHEVTVGSSLLDVRFFVSLFVALVFVGATYFLLKYKQRIAAFALVWFVVFFAPLLIFFKVAGEQNNFFERYLFGSSVGFALFMAVALGALWNGLQKKKSRKQKKPRFAAPAFLQAARKRVVIVFLVLFVGVSFVIVIQRSQDWKDTVALMQKTLEQSPHAVSMRVFLANDLLTVQNNPEAARREYERIIRDHPDYSGIGRVYNRLGDYYRQQGDLEKAQENYEKATSSGNLGSASSYNNLGAFYIEQNQYLRALVNVCKALQLDPQAVEPQVNYSRIVGAVEGVPDEQFIFLYQDVMFGGVFEATLGNTIEFKKKICVYGACSYTFTPTAKEGELFFPFLIMANAFPEEVVKIDNTEFNPQTNEITLAIDASFKDRLVTFSFPSCSGLRYDVQVSPR